MDNVCDRNLFSIPSTLPGAWHHVLGQPLTTILDLILPWAFCFCVNVLLLRECFALAVNVLLLPWEFCSCRDELWIAVIVFVFAVSVYSLPGVIWICCFKIVFCGDELSFGVTVVGHRIRASHSSRVTKWPGYYARSVWYRQSPKAAWPSG